MWSLASVNNRDVLTAPVGIFTLKAETQFVERRGFDVRILERALLRHRCPAFDAAGKPGRRCGLRVPGLHPHECICALTRSSACISASRPHEHRQAHVSANQWPITFKSPTSRPIRLRLGTAALLMRVLGCRWRTQADRLYRSAGVECHGFAFSA